MLMKHCQVTRDGKVSEPALAQLTYGALLRGRCAMVADAGNVAKKALTIALRYAAVRRQFKVGSNEVSSFFLRSSHFLSVRLIYLTASTARNPTPRLPDSPTSTTSSPLPSRRNGIHRTPNEFTLRIHVEPTRVPLL